MSAPKILPSQAANAGATAATSAAPVPCAPPFDAILMLEALAASAAGRDAAGIAAGAAELGAEDAESSDEIDGEDSAEDGSGEADGPLAFLAGLIAVATPPPAHPRMHAAAAESPGAGGSSPLPAGASNASALPQLADAAHSPEAKSDEAAARALAAQAVPELARAPDEPGTSTRGLDLLAQASRGVSASAAEHASVATHVRDPRWADEFGARIATLVNQRESIASISLTPVDLGPVEVSVTVRDSQATIHFGAAQAETRALLEASLPRLRELLAAQGFQLMDASVSQGFHQSRHDEPSVPRPTHVEEVTPVTTQSTVINGLLDTYA